MGSRYRPGFVSWTGTILRTIAPVPRSRKAFALMLRPACLMDTRGSPFDDRCRQMSFYAISFMFISKTTWMEQLEQNCHLRGTTVGLRKLESDPKLFLFDLQNRG